MPLMSLGAITYPSGSDADVIKLVNQLNTEGAQGHLDLLIKYQVTSLAHLLEHVTAGNISKGQYQEMLSAYYRAQSSPVQAVTGGTTQPYGTMTSSILPGGDTIMGLPKMAVYAGAGLLGLLAYFRFKK